MDSSRPLQDAPDRSYVEKLERFARFAEPELRGVFSELALPEGAVVLDLGCGPGLTTGWLGAATPRAFAVGLDLSLRHLHHASGRAPVVQGDLERPCFRAGVFDLIWCCNTINHVADPIGALLRLRPTLRPGGRLVIAQSGLLPEMFFAWDAPLDEAVRRACHEYYRARYRLAVEDTAGMRGLVRLLRGAGLEVGRVRTLTIERLQPLTAVDREYFATTIFADTWGERLKPFMSDEHWQVLRRNIDHEAADYCLDRDDFHHIQTLTVAEGHG
jgi:SAM-dependent methyltransferase